MISPTPVPSSPALRQDVSLADLSTLKVGGTASWFTQVHDLEQLQQTRLWAAEQGLPIFYLGEGSNVLFSDEGFPGLIVQNCITGIEQYGEEVEIGGGQNLLEAIRRLNRLKLSGIERLYGIPGTLAGALVGNAGAYGQQIGDSVVGVSICSDHQIQIPALDLDFRYRCSLFQRQPDWFILSCRLRLQKSSEPLQDISDEILTKRLVKYPQGLKCPGSFFKNVQVNEISETTLEKIPEDFIMFGKIPAGKLLEAVGANGVRRGDAQFAEYHGNLIVNLGGATSQDILTLADEYSGRVWERFQIRLEPEIFIVDNGNWANLKGKDE